jgi:glycosyltransferase XagB
MDEAVRIAFEAGLPFTGLRDFRPDERLWRRVAPEWAARERVVPLLVVGGRLKLASVRADPDLSALAGAYAGVDVVIAPAAEIDAALADVAAPPAVVGDRPNGHNNGRVTDPAEPTRLGDLLVAHGVTTDARVAEALAEQERTGGLLGDVLLARDAVDEHRLLTVLAEQLGLPVVDLTGYEPDPEALALVPEELQRRLRCVPLAVDEHAVYLAVADPLDDGALATLRERTGGHEPRCFLAARDDVDALLQGLHAERWAAGARAAVRSRFPEESSAGPAPRAVLAAAALLTAAAIAGLIVAPATTGLVLVALAALATAVPALLALPVALAGRRRPRPRGARPDAEALPLTTLLLPFGGGPGAAVSAAATLAALDHPRARLEVLLLCRAQDAAGIRAARELTRHRPHRLIVAPADVPPSRGALLDYGLLLARGEHVAVLDPGDVPDPHLLQAAGDALAAAGRRTVAAQAALAPSAEGGLVPAWQAAERAAWHDLLAPGLARLGLPLPLATTGLVLRRAALEEIAGWDPASAAEGVDLGVRLHKSGLRATTVDAAVGVAAPGGAGTWLRAHARWWQGALRAWLVQLRHPFGTARRLGPGGTTAAGLLGLAAVAGPLVWLPVVVVAVLAALQGLDVTGALLTPEIARLAGAEVVVVCVVLVVLGVAGALRRRSGAAARAALLAPVGFTLAAVGAWMGVAGLLAGGGRSGSDGA